MPEVLFVENEEEVLDVTETANRYGHLRAERKGTLAFVLTKLDKPVVRFDGKRVSYQIEDMVLSQEENELACVFANDFTFHSAKELAPFLKQGKPLFSFLTVY